ncbi:MarR family winged helix-turn-helix transcriptional regulator [Agromyces mediolanus]|uniref:MarR family winged helix-turn-helix transcriptional regulator n=1 Tax=Agromyces mediolanus TaxID=41986 RepID=UPI00383253E9
MDPDRSAARNPAVSGPADRPSTGRSPAPDFDSAPDAGEVDYWSFVDHFAKNAGEQRPWLDLEAAEFFMTLHRAFELIVYDIRGELEQRMSSAALRVLLVLTTVGPSTLLRVTELTGMSRAAVSALLKRLEADGLVDRSPSPEDGRSIVIQATEEGKRACDEVYRDYNARESFWYGHLDPEEAEAIKRGLSRLAASVSEARRRS